jgi:hypothetical protein
MTPPAGFRRSVAKSRALANGQRGPRFDQAGLVSNKNISAPPVAKFATSAAAACPSAVPNAL